MKNKIRKTRYFVFFRINPKQKDYGTIKDAAEKIDAQIIHRTVSCGKRIVLKGLLILRGKTTCETACALHVHFPNFLVVKAPKSLQLNFEGLHEDTEFEGEHPFQHIRKNLFKEPTLRDFLDGT